MTEGPGYSPPPPGNDPPPGSFPGSSAPPPGGYGRPPGGFGAPPPGGYGPPPPRGYGTPPPGGYGPPPGYGGYGYGGYGQYGGPYGGYPPYGRPPAPKPGLVPLRPLTVGEILDGAFTAIRWNPKTILGSSAIVAAASGVALAVVTLVLQHDVFTNVVYPGNGVTPTAAQLGKYLGLIFATLGVTLLFTLATRTILTGVLTVAIGQGVLGWKETLGRAWRAAVSGFWRLVGTLLLKYLFLVGGLILAILLLVGIGVALGKGAHAAPIGILIGVLGGIAAFVFFAILTIRWSLAIPITMLERTRPLASLGRSWRLVKGSWWRIFGISLLTSIIVGIAGEIIQIPFSLAGGGFSVFTSMQAHHGPPSVTAAIVAAIGGIIAQTVTSPMTAGVTVLLYADLRMRREGLDISLQAAAASPGSQVGGQPGTQGIPSADPSGVWLTGTGPNGPQNPGHW